MNKKYRVIQFDKVSTVYNSDYRPKIKISKPDGETHHMDITEKELRLIRCILTGEKLTDFFVNCYGQMYNKNDDESFNRVTNKGGK